MPNDQGLGLDQIIQQTSPGWRPVGDPVAETQMATDVTGAQKPTPTGRWLATITDGKSSRQLVLRAVSVEGPTGKVSWSVEEGPKDVSPSTNKGAPLSQLQRIDAQGKVIPPEDTTTPAVKLIDPNNSNTVVDLPNQKVGGSPSGNFKPIPDPRDPSKVVGMVDTGDNSFHQLTAPPPAAGPTNVGGARWIPDPSNPANEIEVVTTLSPDGTPSNKPTGASRKAPAAAATPAGNVIWQDIPGQPGKQQGGTVVDGTFQPIAELVKDKDAKPVAVYGTGPTDRFRIVLDDKGQVVSKDPNENYVGEKPTQLTPDLISPTIPLLKPDGSIQWVPNQNRVMANDAMQALMDQVGVKVNAQQMSMADAKDLLTGTVNVMNAQTARANATTAQNQTATTAAGDILANTRGNAQTGSSLLQQRVQAATGTLQSILGNALQNKNITSIPGDVGANLVQGLSGWTAELMGGQSTMDSAARMVQAADPNSNVHDPTTQAAIATLGQMLDKYQQMNGGVLHPLHAAADAANASQQQGGVVAPPTVAQPAVAAVPAIAPIQPATGFQAPYDPRFQPQQPQQPPGTLLPAGIAGTVPFGDPRFMGFIAPAAAPQLASSG